MRYLIKLAVYALTVNILLSAKLLANISEIQFEHYSVAQGLSQATVSDIVEDPQGFLWFATDHGLNRYDGYEFVQYHHKPHQADSLPGQLVRDLLIDTQGRLWVGTNNGLALYQPESDSFRTFSSSNSNLENNLIWAIANDYQGDLLVADESQLYRYDEEGRDFVRAQTQGTKLPPEIRAIYAEQDKTWIGSFGHGIYLLEHNSNTLYDLSKSNPFGITLPAAYLFDIQIINQQYWLATELGLYIFDQQGNHIAHYHTQSPQPIVSDQVRSMALSADNKVWLATNEGISILNLQDNSVFSINSENDALVGLTSNFIFKVYNDKNNTLWLGSHTNGLYKFNPTLPLIKHYQNIPQSTIALSDNTIWRIKESSNGDIWLATQNGGLNRFQPKIGRFSHYLKEAHDTIWDMALDDQDRIWLSTDSGLYLYQIKEEQEPNLVKHFSLKEPAYKINILGNNLWLESPSRSKIISISLNSLILKEQSIGNKSISYIRPELLDSNKNLWLITNLGLVLFNIETKEVSRILINIQNSPLEMIAAIEGASSYWLSTNGSGLLQLEKDTYNLQRQITTNDGLSGNEITNLIVDDNALWISNLGSIEKLSLSDGSITRLKLSRELLNFNPINDGAGYLSKDRKLYFGGTNGLNVFNPDHLKSEGKAYLTPEPVISILKIYNRQVNINSSSSPLKKPIQLTSLLTLPNNAFPFSLTLSSINPLTPKNVEYRYKLNGLHNDWILADQRTREANFTSGLLFGTYQFEAQARQKNGNWSPSRHLQIEIEPPFWLNNRALTAYACLVIALATLWVRQLSIRMRTRKAIRESEERLKLTLWSSGDELWDWDVYNGQVHRANTWDILDFPQDDIRANSAYQCNIHSNDLTRVQQALKAHIDEQSDFYEITYRARTYTGEWIWLLDRGKVVERDNNNQPLRMTGTLKNISHLKEAEEKLRLFQRSIETISDGVFITDTHFRFISVNKAYCECTGEMQEQALASYLSFQQYPDAFTQEVKKTLAQKGNWVGEIESRRINGEKYELELNIDAVQDENGNVSHYVGVFSDITSRKSTEKELLKLANTDPLTEMPNRSFFQASHNNMVRKNKAHALICLDMDNFKKINDSLGHQSGDMLIKQIAKRLQKITGVHATCYRLGGDEFSLLIDGISEVHKISRYAQLILDELRHPFTLNRQDFVLGASVGIAFYPEDGQTPQELLKNADTAMYFAKNAGGNNYQFFSEEMNQNAVRQLQIENLIRQGLKDDAFSVFYQPKVDIATGKLVSMEALVRLEHPEKGIVSPAQFIPLAEQTGQIVEIGEAVMRKACIDTKRWVDMGLFSGRVAVNISARQFELPDLDDRIEKSLRQAGLSPLHLECEITEGTLMDDPDQALKMMQRLREKGIHLALDDFGTGYSSLAYLKEFPLNTLKIDKAFIDDIANSSVDKHMAAAIISIAHNLGLKVVAEGVEDEKQLQLLRQYQCEMLQGYLYSKPLSASRFERLLQKNQQLDQLIAQRTTN